MHNSTFSSIEKCNSQDLIKARKAVNKYVKIKLLLTVGNLRRQTVCTWFEVNNWSQPGEYQTFFRENN